MSSPSGSASTHSSASTAASDDAELVVARADPREPEVVREGADEDVLLLRHERHLSAERLERQVDESDPADVDPSRPRRMNAREQSPQRRLPGPRRPDDGDPLARLEVEVEPVEDVVPLAVRVADVVRLQPLADRLLAARRPVVRNLRDSDEPRERGRPDLDLVEPRDQAVDRVDELLDIERDGGHLADRGTSGRDEPTAPDERGRDGQDVGDLDGREPDRAQVERSPLGCVGVLQIRVDPADPLPREPERVDRPATVHGLADGAGQRRVGRPLPEIPRRRVAEVPARAEHDRRQPDDARDRGDRADEHRRGDGQHGRHGRDQRLRNREPNRPRERVHVGGRARDEVAGAGPFDGRERQRRARGA